jgi:hypothetical protein
MNLSCSVKIGNLSFNFHCPSRSWREFLKKKYGPFFSGHAERSGVNITIEHGFSRKHLPKTLKVVEKNSCLSVSRYDFSSTSSGDINDTVLRLEKNKYSLDSWFRVFFTLYGIRNNTILIHGAGFVFRNEPYIFPGRSGQGKSTLIRILGKTNALSDELVCVYRQNRNFYACSTPFWGELKKGDGKIFDRKLKAIIYLKHGAGIRLDKTTAKESIKELLRTVMFFSNNACKVNELLSFLHSLSQNLPARIMYFRKDSTAEAILNAVQISLK